MIKLGPLISIGSRVAFAAAVALSLLAVPGIADAQCPPIQRAEFAIEDATTVFVGRVVATDERGTIAEVRVLSVWKGRDLPETVEVHGSVGATNSDARRFEVGRNYLVIPENSRNPYLATACSPTQAYAGTPSLIPASYQDAAGAAKGRPPIAAESDTGGEAELTGSILPLLALIPLIAIVWFFISRLRSLEPERAPSATTGSAPPAAQQAQNRPFKRRSQRRDVFRTKRMARRTVRRHKRGLKSYRRRQNRQVASTSRSRSSD